MQSREWGSQLRRIQRLAHGRLPLHWLALVATLGLASGCAYQGWVPGGQPSDLGKVNLAPAEQLPLDERVHGELDCSKQNCVDNYRINIPGPGRVTVEARRKTAASSQQLLQLLLKTPEQRVLVDQVVPGTDLATAEHGVERAGRYYVALQVGGGRSEYEITARWTPIVTALAPAEPPPPIGDPGRGRMENEELDRIDRQGRRASTNLGGDSVYDPTYDFQPLRSFAFLQRPQDAFEKGSEGGGAVLGNPFTIKEAQRAVRSVLVNGGYNPTSTQDAEFLIAIGGGTHIRTGYVFNQNPVTEDYSIYYSSWGYVWAQRSLVTAERGTLIIDLVDPFTGKLIWHGWATIPIDPNKDLNQLIRQAVGEILDRFPPT
jgi:hypothetical protein